MHKTVGFCCLKLLDGGDVSAAEVKKSIVNHVIADPAQGERVDALLRKNPALADITKAAKARLESDFAALRKLRDDASGALKEDFGDGEDPRVWRHGNAVTVADGRVTELSLIGCSSLAALPAAIGELGALTELDLGQCLSLVALPDTIGELGALTTLYLNDAPSPPRCRPRSASLCSAR